MRYDYRTACYVCIAAYFYVRLDEYSCAEHAVIADFYIPGRRAVRTEDVVAA